MTRRAGPRAGPGPGLDRRRRAGQRPGRRAGRAGRGGRDRPPPGRACPHRRRCASTRGSGPIDRLRPAASSETARRRGAASLLAESWGPAWRLAARAGLPSHGPLTLPGSWTFRMTQQQMAPGRHRPARWPMPWRPGPRASRCSPWPTGGMTSAPRSARSARSRPIPRWSLVSLMADPIRRRCSAGWTPSPSPCSRPGSGRSRAGSPRPAGRAPGCCSTASRTTAARCPGR